MNSYQRILGKINYWFFLIIAILLPFPQIYLRYVCVLWLVTWALEGRWLNKSLCKWRTVLIPFILFAVWYLWGAVSIFWSSDVHAATSTLERYMGIPLILPMAIWGVNDYYDWKTIRRCAVYSCIAAAWIYVLSFYAIYHFQWTSLYWSETIPDAINIENFAENISSAKHRLFLCSVETLGIILALSRRQELIERYGKKWGWGIVLIETLTMFTLILLTGSRASLFSLLAIIGIGIVRFLPAQYRTLSLCLSLALCAIMGYCIMRFHPRMQEFELHQLQLEQIDHNRNIRFNIWLIALENPADYELYGLGLGQSRAYLIKQYKKNNLYGYAQREFAAHNQYLTEWIELGVFGALFFIFAWISIAASAPQQSRNLALFLVVVYGLNMLTDNMFGKFDGVALWCFWMMAIRIQDVPISSGCASTATDAAALKYSAPIAVQKSL